MGVTVANTGTSFSYRVWSSPSADPGASSTSFKVPSTNFGTQSVDLGRGIRFQFDAATPTDGDYKWSITVPSCSVSTHTHAGEHNERLECSGRGICDRGAGMCKCFDGYSGHACGTQMIVV